MSAPSKLGDRSTSDVVVKLLTVEGHDRDEHIHCHSHILIEKSKYFASHFSERQSTSQTIVGQNCIELYCQESEFDYVDINGSMDGLWHGVRNSLGILRVAVSLGCPQIVTACVNYLEAVPWKIDEEKARGIGSEAQSILARLQPVDPKAIIEIFLTAIHFATSSPPPTQGEIKYSAQEQVEYMLTEHEDEDAPMLTADDEIKSKVKECVRGLFEKFSDLLDSLLVLPRNLLSEVENWLPFESHLSDLSWAWKILTKLEIIREFVHSWMDVSEKIVEFAEKARYPVEMKETIMELIELATKVLEAIAGGKVILTASKRLYMVNVWLPFVSFAKTWSDSVTSSDEDAPEVELDGKQWKWLEYTFVTIILTLPSADQAKILTQWLEDPFADYPDLREAFEMWCYRSKFANRRLASLAASTRESTV